MPIIAGSEYVQRRLPILAEPNLLSVFIVVLDIEYFLEKFLYFLAAGFYSTCNRLQSLVELREKLRKREVYGMVRVIDVPNTSERCN